MAFKINKCHLSQEELKCLLDYDPKTGIFYWKENNGIKRWGGKKAGNNMNGYIIIRYEYRRYQAHRLAWLYMYNEWPKCHIDHIDRNRQNNAINNLRLATYSENIRNRVRKDNKSGVPGVRYEERLKKWRASISINKNTYYLGCFKVKKDAIKARRLAEIRFNVQHACV